MNDAVLRFRWEDIKAFSRASGDRNPLHLSESYARRSPFGRPVVFGVLGGLHCLRHFPKRPGRRAVEIAMTFPKAGKLGYACSMDMAKGVIVVQ